MIKTIDLLGSEACVDGLGGQNVAVKNLGAGTLYASAFPNITAGADNVVEIPAGGGEIVLDARGKVYLLGVGKVQLTGTDYATPPFTATASSGGSGGGGTGDVSKEYVDAQDTTNLAIAKAYTDTSVNAVKGDITQNSNDISTLKTDVSTATSTANAAQTTATAADTAATAASAAAAAAQSTADANKGDIATLQTAMSTAQGEIAANTAAIASNKGEIDELRAEVTSADTKAITAASKAEAALSAAEDIAEKSVVSDEGAFDARYHDGDWEVNIDGVWTKVTTSGGAGVSQSYVDTHDAATLTSANEYTDNKIQPLAATVTQHGEDIQSLADRVSDTKNAIDVLNGTGEGSVSRAVSEGIAEVIADAPEGLNTLKEIADWIENHPDDASAMSSQIQQNTRDIADINNEKTGILAQASDYTDFKSSGTLNSARDYADNKSEEAQQSAQLYADSKAAEEADSAFQSAKDYTDSEVQPLQTAVAENSEDIGDLTDRVVETKNAIDVLNGNGNGSVKKTVADGIAEIIADAPEDFDTLKKISEWIYEHPEDTAAMNAQIQQNKRDIEDINNVSTGILAKANAYTNEKLASEMPTTMEGAAEASAGGKGLVPAPAMGDQNKVLFGNGLWDFPMKIIVVKTPDTDLNDYTETGIYYFSSGYVPQNIPGGTNGWLVVLKANSTAIKQLFFRKGTPTKNDYQTWVRAYGDVSNTGEMWGEWERYAMIDDIPTVSNPNLLDNWYFADPINQRAETTYGGSQSSTFAIDRWSVMRGTLTVLDGKIKIETTNTSSTYGVLFQQSIETYPKEKVTFSVLFGNGELATYTNVIDTAGYNSGYIYQNNTVALELAVYNNIPNVRIRQIAVNGTKCELIAAKLEIGDVQTLARKEGNTWVLNDTPPNKALELAKCQRYFQVFATQSLRAKKAQDFRPTMYKEPTLGTISVGGTTYYTANAEI